MAIRDIVTGGFGNGTFSPGVSKLPTRGYAIGVGASVVEFPIGTVAAMVFLPGGQRAALFTAGSRDGGVFSPGAKRGSMYPPGTQDGDVFLPGTQKGNA